MFHISTCSYSTKYENFAGWNCNFEGKHIRYLGKKSFYTDSDSLHCAQCSPSHSIFGMRMRISKAQNKSVVGYKYININNSVHWYLAFLQIGQSVTNGTFAAQNYSKHSTCSAILKGNILYICNSWDGIDVISLQSALSVFRKVVASPSQSFYIQCVRLFFVMTCSSWLRLSVCAEDWVTCRAATHCTHPPSVP